MTFEEAWKETERVVRCELNVDPNRLIYGDGYAAQGRGTWQAGMRRTATPAGTTTRGLATGKPASTST